MGFPFSILLFDGDILIVRGWGALNISGQEKCYTGQLTN